MFFKICQFLQQICQKILENSKLTNKHDQKKRVEKSKTSSFAEDKFFDSGDLQIFS